MKNAAKIGQAKLDVDAARRRLTRWGRLLRLAVRAPQATPIDLARALAVRDAPARPLVAAVLNRYDRAHNALQAAHAYLADITR
ncbi:hypothetical protein [Nonomuraea bangladeshensis]|uniref:hypothetical protein n=1 Tax=Nonomuraea bangladeshensis TaxID=404385 RepID=UPI003C2BC4A7